MNHAAHQSNGACTRVLRNPATRKVCFDVVVGVVDRGMDTAGWRCVGIRDWICTGNCEDKIPRGIRELVVACIEVYLVSVRVLDREIRQRRLQPVLNDRRSNRTTARHGYRAAHTWRYSGIRPRVSRSVACTTRATAPGPHCSTTVARSRRIGNVVSRKVQ